MSTAEVVRVKVERSELGAAALVVLKKLFRLDKLPLAESRVEIELKGVPTAVVNALRRVVTDEMPGRALQVPADGFDTELTTEAFMLPQFVNQRIALIPLRAQVPADVVNHLRLKLDVTNKGTSTLTVYSGDFEVTEGKMPEPIFNPTFKIAALQPGKRLVVRDIRIATGYGRDNGAYLVARRAAFRHLDIAQLDEKETHEPGGAAADLSGYKVSSLVADPRHHVLTATLAATSTNPTEVRTVFADACAAVKDRLRLIATRVERRSEPASELAGRGIQFTVVPLESGLTEAILQVPGETHTIGELLKRSVADLSPDVANVAYTIVTHENRLNFTIRHASEDVTHLLLKAIRHGIATFETLQRGIMAAR